MSFQTLAKKKLNHRLSANAALVRALYDAEGAPGRLRADAAPGPAKTRLDSQNFSQYQHTPVTYAKEVLGQNWWEKQILIAESLVKYRRVLVKAAHSVGKTHLAAGLVNWFFDCFQPSITITTAPTHQQVVDVLWKEIRTQRKHKSFLLPKTPRMERAPDHYAVGYTANSGVAFQGRHSDNLLIIFDECVGIPGEFWDAAESMMTGNNCYWLAICNPTDTSSRAYEEDIKGRFFTISISALEHPNILYPDKRAFGSLSPIWIKERLQDWCDIIPAEDRKPTDILFENVCYRPQPLAETRLLGRWASSSSNSVWPESVWNLTLDPRTDSHAADSEKITIGCDVARYGDDFTSILVRRGKFALHHETHNGWNTAQTAGRLKQLAQQFAPENTDPRTITIIIDDDGVGGGVVDQANSYRFIGSSAAARAFDSSRYPNRRSEIWFTVMELAKDNLINLSRLSERSRQLLRQQALAPMYSIDSRGRRVVEPKEQTKKRIGRSPDDMDALNLAFADYFGKVEYVSSLYL